MMTDSSEKAVYAAPVLVELGSFEEMTQATHTGTNLDSYVALHHSIIGHTS
jgi:hypothetical protein